jgi:hypothetical protein
MNEREKFYTRYIIVYSIFINKQISVQTRQTLRYAYIFKYV